MVVVVVAVVAVVVVVVVAVPTTGFTPQYVCYWGGTLHMGFTLPLFDLLFSNIGFT